MSSSIGLFCHYLAVFLYLFAKNICVYFSQSQAAAATAAASAVTIERAISPAESRCPMCSRHNWHQLDQEMWRMERWLEYSSATLDAFEGVEPPTTIEQLEDAIQVRSKAQKLFSFFFAGFKSWHLLKFFVFMC